MLPIFDPVYSGKEHACQCRRCKGHRLDPCVQGHREDPLEDSMAAHSSTLAWRIPWIEEPGGLQFIGLQGVGHD